jgi:hypothetical protein
MEPMYGPSSSEERALRAAAYELQRAAGNVLTHADGAESMLTLAVTLAHVEEALDRLSVGMLKIARTVAAREPGAGVDASGLGPETRALCFHLRAIADQLHRTESSCQASRTWTRRVLEADRQRPAADSASEPLSA